MNGPVDPVLAALTVFLMGVGAIGALATVIMLAQSFVELVNRISKGRARSSASRSDHSASSDPSASRTGY